MSIVRPVNNVLTQKIQVPTLQSFFLRQHPHEWCFHHVRLHRKLQHFQFHQLNTRIKVNLSF